MYSATWQFGDLPEVAACGVGKGIKACYTATCPMCEAGSCALPLK
jgi:hypothetical protein